MMKKKLVVLIGLIMGIAHPPITNAMQNPTFLERLFLPSSRVNLGITSEIADAANKKTPSIIVTSDDGVQWSISQMTIGRGEGGSKPDLLITPHASGREVLTLQEADIDVIIHAVIPFSPENADFTLTDLGNLVRNQLNNQNRGKIIINIYNPWYFSPQKKVAAFTALSTCLLMGALSCATAFYGLKDKTPARTCISLATAFISLFYAKNFHTNIIIPMNRIPMDRKNMIRTFMATRVSAAL